MHIGFVADLEALDKDLDDLSSKVKQVSPDAIARCLDAFKTIRDHARTYATLLSLQQETITEKLDALHHKATTMLTRSDDEQLSETPVAVTSVPHQAPPSQTARTITGLIDADPIDPF